ncbi:Hypothetical predicted protein [Scomber scombrus]|uniref:Uncharacterized protein n=1 Tax=Scomber scombrus TaxID=13677 RepID=A0AAV1PRX5_SCOSC
MIINITINTKVLNMNSFSAVSQKCVNHSKCVEEIQLCVSVFGDFLLHRCSESSLSKAYFQPPPPHIFQVQLSESQSRIDPAAAAQNRCLCRE